MHDVACEFACAVRMRSSNGRERHKSTIIISCVYSESDLGVSSNPIALLSRDNWALFTQTGQWCVIQTKQNGRVISPREMSVKSTLIDFLLYMLRSNVVEIITFVCPFVSISVNSGRIIPTSPKNSCQLLCYYYSSFFFFFWAADAL